MVGTVTTLNHAFSPVPLGNDLFFQFGDELALPVVGNFDPPPGLSVDTYDPPNLAPTVLAGVDQQFASAATLVQSGRFADFDGQGWTATVN